MLDAAPRVAPEQVGGRRDVLAHATPDSRFAWLPGLRSRTLVHRLPGHQQPLVELPGVEAPGAVPERDPEDRAAAATGAHHIDDLRPRRPLTSPGSLRGRSRFGRSRLAHGAANLPDQRRPTR